LWAAANASQEFEGRFAADFDRKLTLSIILQATPLEPHTHKDGSQWQLLGLIL